MTRLKFGLIVTLIFCFALTTGCSGPVSNVNTAAGNAAQGSNSQVRGNDTVEELRSLIQIPFEPEEVTWRTLDTGGQNRLVAVVLLTPDEHRKFAAKYGPGGNDVKVNVERWFPVELTAAGETTGEMTIAGKAFPGNEFYQAPYNAGSVIFIPETNYLILDLQSS